MEKMKWLWCCGLILSLVGINWAITVPTNYPTIHEAITAANTSDIIYVLAGTYNEIIDCGNKSLTIIGAGATSTTISGYYDGYRHGPVVTMNANCTLDGFTITQGSGGTTSGGIAGFGIVKNCIVVDNCSTDGAGGIWGEDMTIRNCEIYDNGLYGQSLAAMGGGARLAGESSIENCKIYDNTAEDGGGLYCYGNDGILIKNCVVKDNQSLMYGGGIYSSGILNISNSTVVNNSSDDEVDNGNLGNGLLVTSNSSVVISNSIFWDNNFLPHSEDPNRILIYSNYLQPSSLTVNYSNIEGGQTNGYKMIGNTFTLTWGSGNINQDPCFVDGYHLSSNSVCIDSGDPTYTPATGETDIDGQDRKYGSAVDMGADETYYTCTTCLGDLDDSGFIDFDDYVAIVGLLNDNDWYIDISNPAYRACADMDSSNSIDFDDYVAIVGLLNENDWYLDCP